MDVKCTQLHLATTTNSFNFKVVILRVEILHFVKKYLEQWKGRMSLNVAIRPAFAIYVVVA